MLNLIYTLFLTESGGTEGRRDGRTEGRRVGGSEGRKVGRSEGRKVGSKIGGLTSWFRSGRRTF
jgi:hypothetical protein